MSVYGRSRRRGVTGEYRDPGQRFRLLDSIPRMSHDASAAAAPSPPARRSGRGVLYIRWGPNQAVLQRSIDSVRAVHPELPIHVHHLPDDASLLDKASMLDLTPFEETLFLDVDTVILDRLDFGFEMARRHRLACCICECPWARRYGGVSGDLVEYNTGVLFFTAEARPIFDAWRSKVRSVDSSITLFDSDGKLLVMPCNDQAAFSLAVAESARAPFILPLNWNFRPLWQGSWWGPIKIWHDYEDPPEQVVAWSREQARSDAIIEFAILQR